MPSVLKLGMYQANWDVCRLTENPGCKSRHSYTESNKKKIESQREWQDHFSNSGKQSLTATERNLEALRLEVIREGSNSRKDSKLFLLKCGIFSNQYRVLQQ